LATPTPECQLEPERAHLVRRLSDDLGSSKWGDNRMGNLTFLCLAERVLDDERRPLSPHEIWTIAVSKGYDRELRSTGKTPQATLYSAIMTDAQGKKSRFVKVHEGPARYFLKRLTGVSR
jgi:hypothetical protein